MDSKGGPDNNGQRDYPKDKSSTTPELRVIQNGISSTDIVGAINSYYLEFPQTQPSLLEVSYRDLFNALKENGYMSRVSILTIRVGRKLYSWLPEISKFGESSYNDKFRDLGDKTLPSKPQTFSTDELVIKLAVAKSVNNEIEFITIRNNSTET